MSSLKNYFKKGIPEAGCDEAGRGCLAGPVFAAAVILPEKFNHPKLNDSKKTNERTRLELRTVIEKEAIAWAIGICDQHEVDKLNILWASISAMHKAIKNLKIIPKHIIVDGNKFLPYEDIPHKCIIKGDSKFKSIAAASILAKTYRDDFMMKIHKKFPDFNWAKNKGYPTQEHKEAINKYGITIYHRRSFKLYSNQLKIDF